VSDNKQSPHDQSVNIRVFTEERINLVVGGVAFVRSGGLLGCSRPEGAL
jgi:hypothetical protein